MRAQGDFEENKMWQMCDSEYTHSNIHILYIHFRAEQVVIEIFYDTGMSQFLHTVSMATVGG